ncbi:MAG: hypothetical protein WEB90_03645 [Gemmatimonadota bacterium]
MYCKAPPVPAEQAPTRRRLADTLGRRSTSVLIDRVVATGRERSGSRVADALERGAFVDLFPSAAGVAKRITIAREVTDFSGLGELERRAGDKLSVFVDECNRRFANLDLDRRLENVTPRGRLLVGGPVPPEGRKLLSFGTLALSELLGSISEDLRYLTQFELGTRLAYLMVS